MTSGERLVAAGWTQSEIRGTEQRQILFELEQVRVTLRGGGVSDEASLVLDKAFSNLLRLWADV